MAQRGSVGRIVSQSEDKISPVEAVDAVDEDAGQRWWASHG